MPGWRSIEVAVEASVGGYVSSMARADKATRGFGKGIAAAAGGMAGFEAKAAKLDRIGGKLSRNLTLPILAAGGAAVKLASDFNKSFGQMQALAGVSAGEVAGLKTQVLGLSGETARAPQELAAGLYNVRSSGLAGAAAMDVLELSAKGAAIGLGETRSLTDLLTSVMTAYAGTGLTAADATDQLIAAIAAGKAEPAEMAGVMGQLLPVATELGIGFDELAGSVGFLSLTSGDTSKSATQLSGIMLKLLKPTKQGADELERVGLSADQLRSVVSEQGLLPALQLLDEKLGGNAEAMGRVFDDSEGLVGVLGLLRDGGAPAAAVLEQVANSAGGLAEAFALLEDTPEFKFQQDLAALQVDLVKVGTDLIPIVSRLSGGVSDLVSVFSVLPGPVQTGILAFVGLAAAIGPIAKVSAGAMTGVAGLVKAANSKRLDGFKLGLMGMGNAGAGASNKLGTLLATASASPAAWGVAAIGVGALTIAYLELAGGADKAQRSADQLVTAAETAGKSVTQIFNEDLARTLNDLDNGLDIGESSTNFARRMKEMGVSASTLSDALLGTDRQFQAFRDQVESKIGTREFRLIGADLDAMRGAGKLAQEGQKDLTATQKELGIETEATTGAQDAQADATAAQAEQFDTVADKISAAEEALRGFYDSTTSVLSAQLDVKDAIASFAEGLKDGATGFDQNTQAGRDNINGLIEFRDMAVDASVKVAQQSGNVEDGIVAMNGYRTSMIDAAVAAGANRDEVTFMLAQMGLTPEEVRTEFLVNSNIAQVDTELNATADQKRIAVIGAEALTANAEFGLASVTDKGRVATILADALAAGADFDLNTVAGRNRAAIIVARAEGVGAVNIQLDDAAKTRTAHINLIMGSIQNSTGLSTGQIFGHRWGGIHRFAQGGLEDHRAQVAWPGTPMRVWNEPETGGEAYIPRHGPDYRALSTLAVAASWYRATVVPDAMVRPMAAGGTMPSMTTIAPRTVLVPTSSGGRGITVNMGGTQISVSGNGDKAIVETLRRELMPELDRKAGQLTKLLSRYSDAVAQ